MDFLIKAWKPVAVLCLVIGLFPRVSFSESATESKVKSAFIYNFAKFVKWPSANLPAPGAPLIVCTLGGDLQDELQEILKDKKIDDHPLLLRRVKATAESKGCQILFISGSEIARSAASLESLEGILTISEVPNLKDRYLNVAIITFVPDSSRIRFAISNKIAEKEGVEISSKLLTLAITVDQ